MTSVKAELRTGPAERPIPARPALIALIVLFPLLLPAATRAGGVTVVDAAADCVERTCRFEVTLEHADTGWDHYADQWRVLDGSGNVLGVRTLAHPHVDEQPFTRSLGDVHIPEGVAGVIIDARDSVHGISEQTLELDLDLP